MEPERLPALAGTNAMGVGLAVLGWLGRWHRLDVAIGGWTLEWTTDASWGDADRAIRGWFMVAGGCAVATGLVCVAVPVGVVGPVVVAGSVALLVPVVIGVVSGTNRAAAAGTCRSRRAARESNTCSPNGRCSVRWRLGSTRRSAR